MVQVFSTEMFLFGAVGAEIKLEPAFTDMRHDGHSALPIVQPVPNETPMRRAASMR